MPEHHPNRDQPVSLSKLTLPMSPAAQDFLACLSYRSSHMEQNARAQILQLGRELVLNLGNDNLLEALKSLVERAGDRPEFPSMLLGVKRYGEALEPYMIKDYFFCKLLAESGQVIDQALSLQLHNSQAVEVDREIIKYLHLRCHSRILEFLGEKPEAEELRIFLRRFLRAELILDASGHSVLDESTYVDSEELTESFCHVINVPLSSNARKLLFAMYDQSVAENDPLGAVRLTLGAELLQHIFFDAEEGDEQAMVRILELAFKTKKADSQQFETTAALLHRAESIENRTVRIQFAEAMVELLSEGSVPVQGQLDKALFLAQVEKDYPQLFLKIGNIRELLSANNVPDSFQRLRTVTALRASKHSDEHVRKEARKVLAGMLQSHTNPPVEGAPVDRNSYISFQLSNDPSLARYYSNAFSSSTNTWGLRGGSVALASDELAKMPSSVQRALIELERIDDLYFGYGALLFESKRPPSGEPALLSRFALDHGKLHYLNALDPNSFPGRGVIISQIRTSEIFPLKSPNELMPFSLYQHAWPRYAAEIGDLEKAEILLARGVIFISVKDTSKYSLKGANSNISEQYGLAVFNSHFGDPASHFAALVPVKYFGKLLRESVIDGSHFTGVTTGLVDLMTSMHSAEHLCSLPGVIPLSQIDSLLGSFTKKKKEDGQLNYFSALRDHDAMIRVWDKWFISRGPISEKDAQLLSEYTGVKIHKNQHARTAYSVERALHNKAEELGRRSRESLPEVIPELEVSQRLLNIFDLFKISLSYWHRGYSMPQSATASDQINDNSANNEDSLDDEETPSVANAQDGEVLMNSTGARMLEAVREFHQARSQDRDDPKQFPILASCSALKLSGVPDGYFYLDTYSLEGKVHGRPFRLDDEPGNIEDTIFFLTEVISKLQDREGEIRDLRFFSRAALNQEFFEREDDNTIPLV